MQPYQIDSKWRQADRPLSWDIGFLVFGVILIGAGWVLYRRGFRKLAASAR